jgi:hypothetical protein
VLFAIVSAVKPRVIAGDGACKSDGCSC